MQQTHAVTPDKSSKLMPVVLTAITVVIHMSTWWYSHDYAELFRDLGVPLPIATKILLPDSLFYFVLPTVCILGLAGRLINWRIPIWPFVASAIVSVLLVPAFAYGMSLPIIELSNAIE